MDILKYISFSLLENIGQKLRGAHRGETQKFSVRKIYILPHLHTFVFI